MEGESIVVFSQRTLLRGAALVGLLGLTHTSQGHAARAAAAVQPLACGFAVPSSHILRILAVSSGPGPVTILSSGGYTFRLARSESINASVRQNLGATPPAGDAMALFSLGIPGGHYYVGLTNVVQQGAGARVCLRGVAYRDLGNVNADRTPPVTIALDGSFGTSYARVDLQVGAIHYYVYGRPRTT